VDSNVVRRQRAVSDADERERAPLGARAAHNDTHDRTGYAECCDPSGRGETSVTDDIKHLWPKLAAGMRYLRDR
jgi:hypothetical protein